MTNVAFPGQMVLRWFVAVAADELGSLLTLDMTLVTGRRLMGALQGHRVQLGRQAGTLEAGWGVTLLTVGPKVAVRWLVAVAADELWGFLTLNMTLAAVRRLMGPFQGHGVHVGGQGGVLEGGWGVAVLAVGAKVAVWWLMTPGTVGCH